MENFVNVTEIIKKYNAENKSSKVIAEFFSNNSTKNAILLICSNNNISRCYYARKGKMGATYFHPDLVIYFNNWLYKLPNKTFSRDELEFSSSLEEVFKGVLTFKRQYNFGGSFVDLYCNELNLCIEYDECHHSVKLRLENDINRQKLIETEYNVRFIRHKHKDNIFITINKILKLINF